MESPATADEADDSYRTLGAGRSSPGSHAITAMFALVFDASQELIATLSILGILTAVAEYALGSGSEHQQ
jgi:hypothetical protein